MRKVKVLAVVVIAVLAAVNVYLSKQETRSDLTMLNLEALANDFEWTNPEIDVPWGPDLKMGKIKDVRRCKLDEGGGFFTSSVEQVCLNQYVSYDSTCTEYACGESFGS